MLLCTKRLGAQWLCAEQLSAERLEAKRRFLAGNAAINHTFSSHLPCFSILTNKVENKTEKKAALKLSFKMNKLWPAKVSGSNRLQHWGNFDEDIEFFEWKARFSFGKRTGWECCNQLERQTGKSVVFGEFPAKLAKNTQRSDALATSSHSFQHNL